MSGRSARAGRTSVGAEVRIRYHRPPNRTQTFRQRVVHTDERVVVTLAAGVHLEEPVRVDGRTVLEPGADAVWFTFPDVWHDIGRFHLLDGTFTGLYANVLTPVRGVETLEWDTTDLFLDVWLDDGGAPPRVLDEDEFDEAVASGALDDMTATRARNEVDSLVAKAGEDGWPPALVHEWTVKRCRDVLEPTPPPR